jgi:hypothetical protein
LRDDGVDIDLPSREEIERALIYLKNNKAAKILYDRLLPYVNVAVRIIRLPSSLAYNTY